MSKKALFFILICCFVIGLSVGYLITKNCYEKAINNIEKQEIIITDTITITDTICKLKEISIKDYDTLNFFIYDTIINKDTFLVKVPIPISEYEFDTIYKDSVFNVRTQFWINGYDVKLDSVKINCDFSETLVNKKAKYYLSDHLGFGVYSGFGYGVFNKNVDLQIGFGFVYKL